MAFNFTNRDIVKLLRSVAAAYEVKGANQFRVIAYRRAADSVEHATSEAKDLWDDGKLNELAGAGKGITAHLDELFKKGKVKHFRQVMSGLPPAMFEMFLIPGIGAKTAYKLCKSLKIKNAKGALNNLEKAAKKGEIRIIEGFGEASEEEILKGIQAFRRDQIKGKRMLLSYADVLAQEIIFYLHSCSAVIRVDTLGSLRRRVSTVGDVDIAVATEKPEKIIKYFLKYPRIKRVLAKGKALCYVMLKNGREVNIRPHRPQAYGSLLQHFTGSKYHNIALREFALKKGYSLSEYGAKPIGKTQNSKLKTKNYNSKLKTFEFKEERKFYNFLGLDWIPSEIRENQGEIEAARKHLLPKLVESDDIKGDLHIHSNFPIETSHDDGLHSFEEMLEIASDLKYQYLGFTEHNPSTSKHSENQIIEILKRKKEMVDQLKYSYEKVKGKKENKLLIYPLNGLEIDIKPSGKLAIPDKGLELLDYVIASVHSSLRITREKMTQRVLTALSHPKVKILGHPTGRILSKRAGYELTWDKIFDFCLRNNKFLEICAYPDRLDLPDVLVREAVKNGVKMIIDTDSHQKEHLSLMEYGASVARRGWAARKDIINTLPLAKFLAKMNIKR